MKFLKNIIKKYNRGWNDKDLYLPDVYIAKTIADIVSSFMEKEIKEKNVPARIYEKYNNNMNLALIEWEAILSQIVEGFREYEKARGIPCGYTKKIENSFKLLEEYFQEMWSYYGN